MTIKDKACDYVTKINNVEFMGEGEPVYSFEQLQDAFLAGAAGKQELYEALKELYEADNNGWSYDLYTRVINKARTVLAKYEQEKKQ